MLDKLFPGARRRIAAVVSDRRQRPPPDGDIVESLPQPPCSQLRKNGYG
jgi:hypothetical protein